MLAAASAAAVMHIPVIHIAEARSRKAPSTILFRHAIRKMASLHLTATENISPSRDPDGRNAGGSNQHRAMGVWNGDNTGLMSRAELESDLGFSLEPPLALVTYHPRDQRP